MRSLIISNFLAPSIKINDFDESGIKVCSVSSESDEHESLKSKTLENKDLEAALVEADKTGKRLEHEQGRYHLTTLEALLGVAALLIDLQRFSVATDALVDLRERAKQALYPDHPLAVEVLRQFARLYEAQGLIMEATGFLKLLTQVTRNASHYDVELLLDDHLKLADLFGQSGAPAAAQETLESAIIQCAHEGSIVFSPKGLEVMIQLGLRHFQSGEWDQAYDLLIDVVTRFSEHPDFDVEAQIKIDSILVDILLYTGEYAKMEAHLSQLVSNLERVRDLKDSKLHSFRQELLSLYMQLELYDEAMAVAARTGEICKQAFGERSTQAAEAAFSQGEIAYATKDYPEARKHLSEALDIFSVAGQDHQRCVAEVLHNLATVAIAEESHHEARFLFEKALKIREEVYGESHQVTIENIFALGTLFKMNRQSRLAVTYLTRCHALSMKYLGASHMLTRRAAKSLEQLEATAESNAEEVPALQTTIHVEEESTPNDSSAEAPSSAGDTGRFDSSRFITNMFNTAVLEFGNQEYRKAISLLSRTLEVLEKKLGSDHVDLIPVLQQLAEANAALGRDDEADQHRVRACQLQSDHSSSGTLPP